jgi:hypothetical protein
VEIFRAFYRQRSGQFVIESQISPRPTATYRHYRCQEAFEGLLRWLRKHGVTESKPLHALRKEYGSQINTQHGIHAASRALRHADIRVTNEYYTDSRMRVTLGLGHLLPQAPIEKIAPWQTKTKPEAATIPPQEAKSVNGTTVDRLNREVIILQHPCVALLLLVQPDLLRIAFSNERLLVGGFLARCLSADLRMKVLYENEATVPEVDPAIMEEWNQHIRALVKTFRLAPEPYWINREEGVRALSRNFHNDIVDQIRGALWDVDTFAMRWVERAWEICLNLHVGLHGIECHRHLLSQETFANAVSISRYFADRQLEVLNAMRIKAINDNRDRLKEILEANDKKPVTLRDFRRRHGLEREKVLNSVKSHKELFGIAELRRHGGGTPSLVVFLRSNPPPKMEAMQV